MEEKKTNHKIMSDKTHDVLRTVLGVLFYIFAATYITLAVCTAQSGWLATATAVAVCVLSILVLARLSGSFAHIVGYAVILGLFVLFGGAIIPTGIFSAFVSATCVFAYLLLEKRTPFVWGLPLIPVILSLLITRTLYGAALSVSALPCSLLLAYSVKNKLDRGGAVCRISLGICISVIAVLAITVYTGYGELSMQAVQAFIDELRESITELLSSTVSDVGEILGIELAGTDTESAIASVVASLFNLLPAIIITLGNITAYIVHSLYLSVTYSSEEKRKEAIPMLSLNMSLVSAVIYIFALILSFSLVSDSTAIYGTAAENVLLILAPGLILTALGALRAFTAKKGSCLGTLAYLGVVFMLISLSVYAIIGVALAGAVLVIISHFVNKKSDKAQQ